MNILRGAIASFCLVLVAGGNLFAVGTSCRTFDEFPDLRCEDLQARLDAYSAALNDEPSAQAYVVVYEGKYWEGRNPRRGEAQAKAARIKDYLVNYRGLNSERITIINAGQRANFTVQLVICPGGAVIQSVPTVLYKDLKFKKGKIKKSEYKWSCL